MVVAEHAAAAANKRSIDALARLLLARLLDTARSTLACRTMRIVRALRYKTL